DGTIDVRDGSGVLQLNSTDGQVRVIGFVGDVESTTVDGDIFLEGDFLKLSATATDGDVFLTLAEKFAGTITSNVAAKTEGVDLIRENDRTLRRGNGSSAFTINVFDGQLVIRDPKTINTL